MTIENSSEPTLSVLMSVFNEEKYLRGCIESILNQSFGDFEFIITDDRSSDNTPNILEEYGAKDQRIKIIRHARQMRLAYSLNEQIKISKGVYLARMDGDDISHPDRFKKQLDYLENHPDIGMVGSCCNEIDQNGEFISLWKRPTSDRLIKKTIFLQNPFIHSSVMIRKSVIIDAGMYDTACKYAQDYDLWLRVAPQTKLANLDEPLIDFRVDWKKLGHKNREARKHKLLILCRHIRLSNYPVWYYGYLIRPLLLYGLPTNLSIQLKILQRRFRMKKTGGTD